MNRLFYNMITAVIVVLALFQSVSVTHAAQEPISADKPEQKLSHPATLQLEELLLKSSPYESVEGFASYYARRFEGRRTTSGHRYNPDKLLSLIHISEPTRRTPISYAVFCL